MAVIHPLFRLIASRPQMIADHVEAYSDLVAEEVGHATSALKKRVILGSIALTSAGVSIVLAGVALMFWAAVPIDRMNAPWALIAVPAFPALVCIWCIFAIRAASIGNGFKTLREQFAADAAMLREVSEST